MYTEYAGWWAILGFFAASIFVFSALYHADELHQAGRGVVLAMIGVIFLGFTAHSLVTMSERDKAARDRDWTNRGCIIVALEQLEVTYDGTPYILDEASGRQRICKR